MFKLTGSTDLATIEIRDNIIECDLAQPRPLFSNNAGSMVVIENNELVGVSDAGSYPNLPTDQAPGPQAPLAFELGVDGWAVSGE